VKRKSQDRSYDPNSGPYSEDNARTRIAPYSLTRSARTDYVRDSVPLYLTDPEGEPDPEEYLYALQTRRKGLLSGRLLMATVAAAALAALYAFFVSDASRHLVINAEASLAAVLPGPSVAAQPVSDSAELTSRDDQLRDSGRISAPVDAAMDSTKAMAIAAMSPTREAISSAYQNTMQGRAPDPLPTTPAVAPMAAAPSFAAPAVAAPPAKRRDPDEFAALMQRAKAMLAVGDISSARLLLERAAEAPDANAALMLAQTYDPQVLGTSDVRSVAPELAKARAWYQKAALLGSADAQQRLAQLEN
jgi:hypothetical protein